MERIFSIEIADAWSSMMTLEEEEERFLDLRDHVTILQWIQSEM